MTRSRASAARRPATRTRARRPTKPDPLTVAVLIRAAAWTTALPRARSLCRRAAAAAYRAAGGRRSAEACVVLASDAFVRDLNRLFRGKDRPTNVLSFPLEGADPRRSRRWPPMVGDVVIAFETAAREAARAPKPLAHHLCHLVIHGILHVLGYDHESDDDARRMERREARALADLGLGGS